MKRIASTLLALAVVAATAAPPLAVAVNGRRHAAHGCQATAPGGNVATIEAAGVAIVVHHGYSMRGLSTRAGTLAPPAAQDGPVHAVFTFARPHDPPHLHAFSLLI